MDTLNSDQLVSLCEPRMPKRRLEQVPWRTLVERTVRFGEVATTKAFVPNEPASRPLRDKSSGQGVMQISIGPFSYHVTYAPGNMPSPQQEGYLVAEAILKNTHRILDTTGKYDIYFEN